MGLSRHNQIANAHFHKDWQKMVKTNFNQPARKLRRSNARKAKAVALAPRPLKKFRPTVRCPTLRYNMRARLGRGFSLEEIKEAGLNRNYARQVGISVDHRRRNLSLEGKQVNVQRLKAYVNSLLVFPRNPAKPTKKENTMEECASAVQTVPHDNIKVRNNVRVEAARVPSDQEKKFGAFHALRQARRKLKTVGKKVAPKEE